MKILVAEDDSVTRKLLVHHLRTWQYEVVEATNGKAALDALMDPIHYPPMAILDWMMPQIDGLELCRMLRARPDAPFIYLILLSGRDSKDDVVSGLDAGADDYLAKPFNPAELRSRIRAGERIIGLQQQLRKVNAELQLLAMTDELTQRLNRPAIMKRFAEELARAYRQRTPLAVLMADIDRFKDVNDTYGHLGGDEVLREFAKRLARELRTYDSVGRYGGEEFLCLMPGLPWDACERVANRVRVALSEQPTLYRKDAISITASFGVAWLPPGVNATEAGLIKLADEMLYQAKDDGRNRVVLARFGEARAEVLVDA